MCNVTAVINIDVTGIIALEELETALKKKNIQVQNIIGIDGTSWELLFEHPFVKIRTLTTNCFRAIQTVGKFIRWIEKTHYNLITIYWELCFSWRFQTLQHQRWRSWPTQVSLSVWVNSGSSWQLLMLCKWLLYWWTKTLARKLFNLILKISNLVELSVSLYFFFGSLFNPGV